MKKLLSIILTLCFIMALCGCDGSASGTKDSSVASFMLTGSTEPSSVIPNFDITSDLPYDDINIIALARTSSKKTPEECITISYPEEELISFITPLSHDRFMTVNELNDRYPLEYSVKINDAFYGFAYKLTQGGYLYGTVFSDPKLFGSWFMVERVFISNDSLSKNDFDSLNPGVSSLEDVATLDHSTARMNAIRTDYINTGCIFLDKDQSDKYALPYTIHSTSDQVIAVVYEDPDDNNGKYIVKYVVHLGSLWPESPVSFGFIDSEKTGYK